MRKIVLNTFKFLILVFVIAICFSNSIVFEFKINNSNIKNSVDLSTMAQKVNDFNYDELYTSIDTYTGDLTGYVYNCPACGGKLACTPDYNVSDNKTFYNDGTYGDLRIVASSTNLSCGTVIRFTNNRISNEPVYAIVLDRGVRGNAIDLLSSSYEEATKLGRSLITYDVIRNGW